MDKIRPAKHHYIILSVIAVLLIMGGVIWEFSRPAGDGTKLPERPAHKLTIIPKPLSHTPVSPSGYTPDFTLPPIVDGMAPVITNVPTKQKVVFLGIDDGAFKDPSVVAILAKNNIKASLFLSKAFIANDPDFFKQITAQGSIVENHTLGHDTRMTIIQGYQQQKNEICGMADYIQQHYGRRPTFFRPPGGTYSNTMRKAAADCGMRAVVTWIAKANGGAMQYQVGNKLRPGDIVLMHFRPEFAQDMKAFVDAMSAAGLHTELLETAQTAK
ncbi:MAG TPA: polysaccharide deacetylase family protein [Candidatus Saccharimonadales bacterium]|nr:polysaccharide deacetylase family protein [Candidatus Saccharimonadales bacterium]